MARGVPFVTLEDETGVENLVVRADRFKRLRWEILAARLMGANGRVQREGEVVHLIVNRVSDLTDELDRIPAMGGDGAADEVVSSENFR